MQLKILENFKNLNSNIEIHKFIWSVFKAIFNQI